VLHYTISTHIIAGGVLFMLTRIRLKNFKSYKNEVIIDLEKTNYKILENQNVSRSKILKGALFVGGNATGKTNMILSLKLLLELLFTENFNLFNFYQCLLCSKPEIMDLEYDFLIDNNNIKYSIKYDFTKKFLIENLVINNNEKLDRKGSTAVSHIDEYKTYDDITDDHLLLREIYFNTKFRGNPILQKWFEFLSNSVYVNPYKNDLVTANTISNDLMEYLNENDVHEINKFLEELDFDQRVEYSTRVASNFYVIENKEKEKFIYFKRKNGKTVIPFPFESLGNQNLIKLLPHYLNVIKKGGMLIIDEFSSGFHNILEELLVKYFMKKVDNGQVFIVSHSTNLLSNNIFRPDQIYTVEFNDDEGSTVYRISDEKPREAQNIEKMYLNGMFNGLPTYKDEI